jgi:hypothetical protein
MDGNEAVAWVNRYICLVEKEIRRFMPNTPYERKDFLHDAYEAALLAAEVSNRKGITFSTAFWRMFKKTAFRVSPCTSAKRSIGVSMSAFDLQEYSDDLFFGGEEYLLDPEEILLERDEKWRIDKVLSLLAERLMPVEKRVISCICGLDRGRMSLTETARFLGMSKGAVHQAFRRIMKKALMFREEFESVDHPSSRKSSEVMRSEGKRQPCSWPVPASAPIQASPERRLHHGSQGSKRDIRNTIEGHRTNGTGRFDQPATG